jgi:hypothetical protein
MAQVKKRSIARSIALALCCSLVTSPVWAKTFVGVLYPFLGPMAAPSLVELAGELKAMPDVEVATYLHQSWRSLVDDINRQPKGTRILIVGYSLGANNAILVANNTGYVDEIIALQPSMLTTQESLTGKVGKIIEIYNPNRWMTFGGMGSQKLEAPNIEYIVNNDSHPGAQFSEQFHSIVKSELARISALDNVQTAQPRMPKPSPLARLSPPKDVKSTALAFAGPEPPKHEQPRSEQPRSEQPRSEQPRSEQPRNEQALQPRHEQSRPALVSMEQTRPQLDSAAIFGDAPKPQPIFAEALSSSANAQSSLVQRTLTVSDMKDYVKRNYPTPQTADVTR